jgi:hypothetical protein
MSIRGLLFERASTIKMKLSALVSVEQSGHYHHHHHQEKTFTGQMVDLLQFYVEIVLFFRNQVC